MNADTPTLRIRGLTVSFPVAGGGWRRAVRDVSLSVHPGQTLAIVGESGSGKSVTAMSVLRLVPSPPARVESGSVVLAPAGGGMARDVLRLSPAEMRRVRGGDAAMIFQEPMTSLNPVFTIGEQITEAIRLHQGVGAAEARERAARALADAGIERPHERLRAYPHEFSGGMRQRAMIAMALACAPGLLIADEPTTALDVTVQAQVLALLRSAQEQRGMAMIFITHNLALVAGVADVVCVMYAGRVVEYGVTREVFESPRHPYTRALLAVTPSIRSHTPRLRTVADVLAEGGSAGMSLPGGRRAWWPHGAQEAPGAALIQVAPSRWAAAEAAPGEPSAEPDIATHRAVAAHAT